MTITKPTLLLNKKRCIDNITHMVRKAERNNVIFRPHFKTHQSKTVGHWYKELGVRKITVSSFEMAEYFAYDFKDITVAFPVNILEHETINALASHITLNLTVESVDSITMLAKTIQNPVNMMIKIDTGYQRTGLSKEKGSEIRAIVAEIEKCPHFTFSGFLNHAGHTYDTSSIDVITQIHETSKSEMMALKSEFIDQYPNLILSTGDTPSCSLLDDFSSFDEIRPGTFVFYDLTQEAIGSCSDDQIAIALACPVVAKHPDRREIILYGGGTHFSKDFIHDPIHGKIYGYVLDHHNQEWGKKRSDCFVKKLSQEHGTVSAPLDYIENIQIGDIIYILPVHSCMMALAMGEYITLDGEHIDHL